MQNVQNAAEIQQRVINLVELYRNKVGRESEQAQKAIAEKNYLDDINLDAAMKLHDEEMKGPVGFDMSPEIPEEEQNKFRVNEQLLGHFYSIAAGDDSDVRVLQELLPNYYNTTIFSDEEEYFLKEHFKEMVNYIIETPTFDLSKLGMWTLEMNYFHIPEQILELIKNRLVIPTGSVVYNPFTCLAQFPLIYKGCTFLCEESYVNYVSQIHKDKSLLLWAWMKVAIYANKMDAIVIEDGSIPSSYDYVVSFIPSIPHAVIDGVYDNESDIYETSIVSKIINSYNHLKQGGQMCLLLPSEVFHNVDGKSPLKELWKQLLSEGAIKEIVQLPLVIDCPLKGGFSIIIVEKGLKEPFATMIDARFAIKDIEQENIQDEPLKVFSYEAFSEMVHNGGKDTITGLRKQVCINHSKLYADLLVPQVFVVERPSEEDYPVPLSSLCSLVSAKVRDVQFDLPEDTPWISMSDLAPLYTGDLNVSGVRKADCPNNPPYVEGSEDYAFDKDGKFVDSIWEQMYTKKGYRVLDYRNCTYLDGNCDAVLYERTAESGIQVAVVRATGKPYAVSSDILVFCPKEDFDVSSLAALLRLPIVYRQLIAYQEYGLGNHLNDILVPTDKRIIGDELYRMKREESVTKEFGDKVQAMKTDYINEVRMRKHDMGQKVFDIINTEDLMRYYVENRETENDLWPQLEEQLDHLRDTIHELSEMLDHLSQEEHFGSPELINLDEYLRSMQHSNDVSGFALSYQLDKDGVAHALLTHNNDKRIVDEQDIRIHPTVWIAKNDIQRIVVNIISNAQKHGFIDSSRRDYEVKIVLSFNSEKDMYQIEFRNNGQPLPEGLNKIRYGIKGEKAGQTAGTGLGGSVVKAIVEHYKGDYDVFMDGEWTVVRIYLPKAI